MPHLLAVLFTLRSNQILNQFRVVLNNVMLFHMVRPTLMEILQCNNILFCHYSMLHVQYPVSWEVLPKPVNILQIYIEV